MSFPGWHALVLRCVLVAACISASGLDAQSPTPLADRIAGREVAILHPPLEDPETRSVAKADHMRPDDVVAGLAIDGSYRAYPWWVLKNHHTVNDRLGGVDLVIAFCEQCSAATAFRRRLEDRTLTFETEGVSRGSIILRDRETDTLWAPFDGKALEGSLSGKRLDRLPTFLTTWDEWQGRHPETDVVYASDRSRHGHGEREYPGKWGIVGVMGETIGTWDTRLAENDYVHGVVEADEVRAYPFRALREAGGLAQDSLGGRPIVVFSNGTFEMAGYDRRLGGRLLEFEIEAPGSTFFKDLESGSRWTIEGLALDGELAGKKLTPLDSYSAEWHIWSEYHPETTIFGGGATTAANGFQFPLTSLPRLEGEGVRNASLGLTRDFNVVLIWARWCAPCHDKLPLWKRLASGATRQDYGFASIAVQIDVMEELSGLKAFVYENEIDWPIHLFDDKSYGDLERAYRTASGRGLSIPMVLVVDDQGLVIRVFEGEDLEGVEPFLSEVTPGSETAAGYESSAG